MKKVYIIMLFLGLFVTTHAQKYSPNATDANTPGTLNVTVTTSATTGATYVPRNVLAIWVQNSSGAFVKTLLLYAQARISELTTWNAISGGNIVDAITGATQTSHGVRTCTWNGTDVSGVVVPDGTYTLKMELTDKNAPGNVGTFTFVKGPAAQTVTPVAVPSFMAITITWTPSVNSAVEDVKMSNLYQVYPNPTSSSIFVNGVGIDEIEVLNMTGKSLLKTNLHKVNLNALPKGVYMLKINSENGIIMKKLVKN
ncbi:MAG: DUF2271 domain-containing protein [Paludibacter sp.]|nr:DUF2271 domain-containing protein [Paludibacter sp.]